MRYFKRACFLGELPDADGTLAKRIYTEAHMLSPRVREYIFSADSAFGLLCAGQIVLRRSRQCGNSAEHLRLVAAVPFEEHIAFKNEAFRDEYFRILPLCDSVQCFAQDSESFVAADFTEHIIDMADIVILADKTEYALIYASARGKKIIRLS